MPCTVVSWEAMLSGEPYTQQLKPVSVRGSPPSRRAAAASSAGLRLGAAEGSQTVPSLLLGFGCSFALSKNVEIILS